MAGFCESVVCLPVLLLGRGGLVEVVLGREGVAGAGGQHDVVGGDLLT